MKKSSMLKLSNSHLFGQIKINLPAFRKFSQVEARLILKQNRDRLFHDTDSEDYQKFLTLAREAVQRKDFNDAFIQINKTIEVFQQSSISQRNPNKVDRARIYELAGKIYKRNYEVQESIALLQKSFRILNKTLGEDNIYALRILFELAYSCLENFRGHEAIFYLTKFYKLRKMKNPIVDEIDMLILYLISFAYFCKQGPKIALRYYERVLELNKKCSIKSYRIKFQILWVIGKIYSDFRQIKIAKKYFRKCLNILTNHSIAKEVSKNKVYNLLVDYYHVLGEYDRSMYYAKRAVKYYKQSEKDNFLKIAATYEYIAQNYEMKHDFKNYFHYVGKHMIILKKIVGTRHPKFLRSLLSYSDELIANGFHSKVLKLLKHVKKELKTVLESNMYLKTIYKLNKGIIYYSFKRTKKSLKKLEETKKLICENFGEYHPLYISCWYVIGKNLHSLEYLDKALNVYERVFTLYQRCYSYYHVSCASVLSQIGSIHKAKGNFSSSLKHYKRCLDIHKKLDLESTYMNKIIHIRIAELYLVSGKHLEFFHYCKKSKSLEVKTNIFKDMWRNELVQILTLYYIASNNYKAAKRVIRKDLKAHISSDTYNLHQTLTIIRNLALTELESDENNYAKANQLFITYKKLYRELIETDEISSNDPLLIYMYWIKAELYNAVGKHEDSLRIFIKIHDIQRQIYEKYDRPMLFIYSRISSVYFRAKRYHECIKVAKIVLRIELSTFNDPIRLSSIYEIIGLAYFHLNKAHIALEYLREKLKLIRRNANIESQKCYLYVGICYILQEERVRSLKYFNKALSSTVISKNMSLIGIYLLNNIGIVYAIEHLFDKALDIFKCCLENVDTNFTYIQEVINNLKLTELLREKERNSNIENECKAYQNTEASSTSFIIIF